MTLVPLIDSSASVEFSAEDGDVLRAKHSSTQHAIGPSVPVIVDTLAPSDGSELFKIDEFRYYLRIHAGTPGVAGSTQRFEFYSHFRQVWSVAYANVSPTWTGVFVDGDNRLWASKSDASYVLFDESDGSIEFTKTTANFVAAIQAAFPPPAPLASTDGVYSTGGVSIAVRSGGGIVVPVTRENDEVPDGDYEIYEGALFFCIVDAAGSITTVKVSQIALKAHEDGDENVVTLASTTPHIPFFMIDPGDLTEVDEPIPVSAVIGKTLKTRFVFGLSNLSFRWSDGDYMKAFDFDGGMVAGTDTYFDASRGGVSEIGEFVGGILGAITTMVILDEDFNDVTPGWIVQHQFLAASNDFQIRRPLCRAFWATNTTRFYMIDYATGEELYRADPGINNALPPLSPYVNTTWIGAYGFPLASPTKITTLVIEAACISDASPQNAPWWIQIDRTYATFSFVIMPHQFRDDV